MAAAIGDTPDANATRVDFRDVLGESDRVLVVLYLVPRVDVLARLAVAGTQTPVVEYQGSDAVLDELGCVSRLPELLYVAPATGHHDDREWPVAVGQQQVTSDGIPAAGELDFAVWHLLKPSSPFVKAAPNNDIDKGRACVADI